LQSIPLWFWLVVAFGVLAASALGYVLHRVGKRQDALDRDDAENIE
jgi:hypothetical protein